MELPVPVRTVVPVFRVVVVVVVLLLTVPDLVDVALPVDVVPRPEVGVPTVLVRVFTLEGRT